MDELIIYHTWGLTESEKDPTFKNSTNLMENLTNMTNFIMKISQTWQILSYFESFFVIAFNFW